MMVLSASLVAVTASSAFSQADSLRSERSDSTGIPLGYLVRPVVKAGLISSVDSYSIPDSVIRWSDYTNAGEVLQKIPGAYLANMYQPGDPSEMSFDGMGSGYTSYLLDGVQMNEPTTGTINLYHIPLEFARNIEYIDAVRAPIYQFNANGAIVNFQSELYSEAVPYSKVRHLEEPYNYLITDGVFSQNIGYNSNIDVGFERQTTDGRFLNSSYDGVNIRGKYRYSIDSTRQITATEVYYRTKGGMTGGAMPYSVTAAIFDPNAITLRSLQADLTYLQHHIQVAYSQSDPHDSLSSLTATAFFDYYSFQFGDVSIPYYLTNLSRRFGVNIRGSQGILYTRLNYGVEATRDENTFNSAANIPSRNRLSAYADEELDFFDLFKGGVFGRGDLVGSKFYPALGASVGIGNGTLSLTAGGSISSHLPTLSQMYFVTQNYTGNSALTSETDRLVQLKLDVAFGETVRFSVKPFMRSIDRPIYYRVAYSGQPEYPEISVVNLGTRDIYGADASVKLELWKFGLDGILNYVREKTDGNLVYALPQYFGSGEFYYRDILFDGHLDLKVGMRGKFLTSFRGNEFYPQALVYYPTDINEFGPFGSTDFFVRGRVGDAVVYLTIFNITAQNYLMAPVYPALDNSFCIGINWEFLN